MLGDAGTSNTDASYGGETGESVFSLQYYRDKAREFQGMLDAMDTTARNMREILGAGVDEYTADELQMWLQQYEDKKMLLRGTAEAINAGAYVINAAGGRFPVMQLPQTLGLAPALPLVAIAALATAATLISWGRDWMAGVNKLTRERNLLATIENPEERARVAASLAEMAAAQEKAASSPLAQIATVAKWGTIAVLAYMGYRAWQSR